MSNWIAIYDAPADNEPPFECLVRGDVFDNCVWIGGMVGQYAQVTGSIAMPLPYMPSHWRPAQSAVVKDSLTAQADCRACVNRGRVNGLSQESYCDSCIYQGRDWRQNHFVDASKMVDAVKRRCEACAILPCSCK